MRRVVLVVLALVLAASGSEPKLTVQPDRIALGGADRRTLFMTANEWKGPAQMFDEPRTGQVLAAPAPAPGAGWP